ncbi:hypothetical protein ACFWUP_15955 [Nocardia sp. NPDC058658]|uniref:hypothetical protein n=1 Tax=Nocardia sp. NPDC058658 TaxID=3346580 RepID=UPI00364CD79C
MTTRHHALPRKPVCLNRDDELRLVQHLREDAVAAGGPLLLAVSGANGVGKTTMLVSLAYRHSDDYSEVLFYEARPADPHSTVGPAQVAESLLVQLGIGWQEIPAPGLRVEMLRSMLARRSVLLALDDIESAEQVLPLLGDLGNAAVLVAGEKHLGRLELADFATVKLRGFPPEHAVSHLRALGGPVLSDADSAELEQLVRLVGGVPLLIEAMAVRLADGVETVAEYLARLRMASWDDMSEELSIDGQPVGLAVCDAAYAGSSTAAATAYRWLSWAPGGVFDLEFAAALLNSPVAVVKRSLRELVERSLLQDLDGEMWEFPVLMRRHANAKSRAIDPADVEHRVLRLCARRAVALARSLSDRWIPAPAVAAVYADTPRRYDGTPGAERASAEFAAGWSGFVAAARRATQLGLELDALTLWVALWPFGYQTFRTAELVDGYCALLDDLTGAWTILDDIATRWQLLRDLAALHERRGEPIESGTRLHSLRALGYAPGRWGELEHEALQRAALGSYEQAYELLLAARAAVGAITAEAQRARSAALIDMHLGRTLTQLGRDEQAEPFLRAAEQLFATRPRDANNAARCTTLLAEIATRRGDLVDARALLSTAALVLERHHMRRNAADVHDRLAELAEPAAAEVHRATAQRLRQ